MRENRCASACPTVVLDLTCVRGTQGERVGGGVRWHSGCLPHLQVPAQAARACSGVRVFGRTGGSAERRRGLEPGDDVGSVALALGRRWRCRSYLPVPA